jgi:putative copper resistance protein D
VTTDHLVVAQIALAAIEDILFTLMVGALACSALPGRPAEYSRDVARRWRFTAAVSLAVSCPLYLWLQAAVMGGTPLLAAWSAIPTVLTQSHFGLAWWVGFGGAALAAVCSKWSGRTAWSGAAAGALIYAAGKAAASHAADEGDFTLPEFVHVIHLCATAAWAGTVIVGAATLYRRRHDISPGQFAARAAFCRYLSRIASISLVVVIGTGIFNATKDTAYITVPWFDTQYGRVLTLKLVFVALAILLGGLNRIIYLPRLLADAEHGPTAPAHARRGFDRLVSLEAATMMAVLVIAAILGHTSP